MELEKVKVDKTSVIGVISLILQLAAGGFLVWKGQPMIGSTIIAGALGLNSLTPGILPTVPTEIVVPRDARTDQ